MTFYSGLFRSTIRLFIITGLIGVSLGFLWLFSLVSCAQTHPNRASEVRARRATSFEGKKLIVEPGGNLQKAIDEANYGDTIVLKAGAEYRTPNMRSPFILRAKTGGTNTDADYITIVSSNANLLPAGRVSPADSKNMARILALGSEGAFQVETGARYYKLMGLEITNTSKGSAAEFGGVLVRIANDAKADSSINNIWIDRCYIHPQEDGTTNYLRTASWGIMVGSPRSGPNTTQVKITNNHISGFMGNYVHAPKEQINSQAIGINLVTDLLIHNNFLQGFFQPVFIGGVNNVNASHGVVQASPAPTLTNATLSNVSNLSVGDYISFKQGDGYPNANGRITSISGNNIIYSSLHRYQSNATPPPPGSIAEWNGDIADRLIITNNTFDIDTANAVFEFNRTDCPGREGSPCRRMPKAFIEIKQGNNVLLEGNIFQGWPTPIAPNSVNQDGTTPWAVVKNLTIRSNWIKDFGGSISYGGGNFDGKSDGHLSAESSKILIENNLFTQTNTLPDDYGNTYLAIWGNGDGITIKNNTWINNSNGEGPVFTSNGPLKNFTLKDNIFFHNRYGFICGIGDRQHATCFPKWIETNNIIVDNRPNKGDSLQPFFPRSYIVPNIDRAGFVDYGRHNYRLSESSKYRGRGTNGSDPGVDIDALETALQVR